MCMLMLQNEMAPKRHGSTREIPTRLTKLLDIKVPVLLAPMSTGAGGSLAGQVAKCGGFGFLAAGDDTVDSLKEEIQTFKDILKLPASQRAPCGVGFLGWYLEAGHKDLLIAALDLKVKAVFFAFSDHMDRWVNFVRDYDQANGRKTIIFVVVHNGPQAAAAADLGVDVVVAQGIEAGGHGAEYNAPLLVQLSIVQKAMPEDGPLIVAAGGIMTGSHVAALLSAGAHGCIVGTRLLMAKESYYTASQRALMVASKSTDATERTLVFDIMVGALGWPAGIDGRAIKNKTTEEYEAGDPVDEIRNRYKEAAKEGDASYIATWAGLGVVLLKEESDLAKDIMNELTEECFNRIKKVSISLK
ncbi:hypothetical protein B0H19DRAFT_537862 [Mycena capillaripes]|nr:hypothetical protein B0H19DRAFT_537862 [Mycena capillaripes]